MGFRCTGITAIKFCLTLMVVRSFGELIILRHPTTDNDTKRKLTCISEDDDGALIWNYNFENPDPDSRQNVFTNFQPKNPTSNIITECAIWNSTQCFTEWENISEWEVVDSATKPIGPVFDYRWEGFEEYLFNELIPDQDYAYVKKVEKSSGTAAFSARGLKDLYVFMCEREKPSAGPCLWIIIGGWEGKTSAIKFCSNGAEPHGSTINGSCADIVNRTHTAPGILDPYEWRTFRIEWNSLQETIKVFKDHDVEPLLDGTVSPWHNVSHVLVGSEISSLIKFHFYEYFRAERKNRELSTKEFEYYGNTFCVRLLVNLCPGCELEVRLTDEGNNDVAIRKIPEDEHFTKNESSTWKSVKLNMNMENVGPRLLRLIIRTVLNEKEGIGRWAIDNFRFCKSDGRRESTISIHRAPSDPSVRPVVKCQKLSDGKSFIVDSFSKQRYHDTSQLQNFLRGRKGCGSTCASFYKNWLICDQTGCTCDRGFTGSDCNRECTDGYHGYNCEKECGSCVSGSCNRTTGYCHTGGKVRRHLSSLSQDVLEPPTVMNITDTTVIVRQELNLERVSRPDNLFCSVRTEKNDSKSYNIYPIFIPPSTYEIEVKNLSFNMRYMVRSEYSHRSGVKISRETVFATTCMGKPRFEVVPEEKFLTVITPQRDEKCGDTRNQFYLIDVRDAATKNLKCIITTPSQFPHDCLNLTPYTEYEVNILEQEGLIFKARVRTLQSAPRVNNLELYDADFDTNTISLRWQPSNPVNNEIQSYNVLIEAKWYLLLNRTIGVSDGVCELWKNYVCLENLELSQDIADDVQLQVRVKNNDVKEFEYPVFLSFVPATKYIEPPGRPLDFAISPEGQDVVTLKWKPPPFTPTKISRFRIQVEVLETFLLESLDTKFPMDINYPVSEKQKEYSMELVSLLPSTTYRVSAISVNGRNIFSRITETLFSMPGYVGFGSNEEPEVKQNGSLIEVKIPRVVNATRNTTVGIIVRGPSTCTPRRARTSSSHVNLTKFVGEWEAAMYKVEKSTPEPLKIFAKQHQGLTLNCSLHREETYKIVFVVTDWYSGASANFTSSAITLINRDLPQGTNLTWLIIFPIITICLLLFLVYHLHRRKKTSPRRPREPSYLEIIPLHSTTIDRNNLTVLNTASESIFLQGASEIPLTASLYAIPNELESRAVSSKYFEEYAKKAAASGLLNSQFMLLPRGLTKPCDYGSLPENMPKNRYRNLIAYDHTRVVLEKISHDPHSDYINASYIKGYRKERAYIAAQGPKPNTVNDFWRMIWQEDVRVICMLVNVVEGVRTMCEKYWPDFGTRVKHGEFLISNVSNRVFADYTLRKFKLSYQQDTREVAHLHYTGWPILGIPSSQSLVAYMKKLIQTPSGSGPVVVHCDTGDGRTGTVILCDICLRQAIGEKIIDVTAVITRMRDSRANMVATPQQYLLAHVIISESMVSTPTRILCTGILSEGIKKMRLRLPADLQRLNDTIWQEEALDSYATMEPLDELLLESVAADNSDVSQKLERKSNQINAVSVDGVRTKNQYLASELPPPLTLCIFWKFIAEENIKLIIILQCSDLKSPTCCDILPDERILLSMPHIQIETETSHNDGEYFTMEKLLLTDTSEENARRQSLTVLTCKGWKHGVNRKPPTPAALVSLWRASEKISREVGETLVLCHDGITGCGLYLALSYVLEGMAVDRECDVITAVRVVHRSIPGFIQSKEQCEYLYDAAETYAEYFQCYANFN